VLLLGFLGGVATLTRPQFVFLPLLLPALVALASKRYVLGTRLALTNSMLIAVPGLLIILVWCAWVYAQTGYFTLSTQSGLGLTNHSIGFVELAPERYAGVRDVLLKHREAKIATKGHSRDTIWDAMPELKQVTGLSLPQISSEVQRMSLELFTRHPLRYGVSVGKGWIGFWLVPNPWEPDRLRPGWLGPVLEALWWLEHKVLRLVNAIFVLFLLAVAAGAPARRAAGWDLDMTAISAVIIASSMIQALAEYGANSRYGVPTQALVVLVVLVALHRYCISRLARQGRVPKGQIG
jgi:hypothetical protein